MEINIDATNGIIGRIASFAAKQALLGNTVNIVNCEKAVMSGSPTYIREKYYHRIFQTGQFQKGPFIPRMSDRFVKRLIRGMVKHKRSRGDDAFKKIMCYIEIPIALKDKKFITMKKSVSDLPNAKYTTIGELCMSLGGRK